MKPEEYPSETFCKNTNIVTGVLETFERKNTRTLESISCPKPVLPLQMVIRPCFEALQVLWCRCRSHDGGWDGIPCCNRSVRKWSQDGVVGPSREGNRELERVRLGELQLASRSWLRRRRIGSYPTLYLSDSHPLIVHLASVSFFRSWLTTQPRESISF